MFLYSVYLPLTDGDMLKLDNLYLCILVLRSLTLSSANLEYCLVALSTVLFVCLTSICHSITYNCAISRHCSKTNFIIEAILPLHSNFVTFSLF